MCRIPREKQNIVEFSTENTLLEAIKRNGGWDRQEFMTYKMDYVENRGNNESVQI